MSRDKRIKCDKCTEEGQTSVIEVIWTSDTLPRNYKCSRGHKWIERIDKYLQNGATGEYVEAVHKIWL